MERSILTRGEWKSSTFRVIPPDTADFIFDAMICFSRATCFASYAYSVHVPPPFLNSEPGMLPASLQRVKELAPRLMLPNHSDGLDGVRHRARFDSLLARVTKR